MLQKGKGTNISASLGTTASATLFGSSYSGNFVTLIITILAILFFLLSLALGNMSLHQSKNGSDWNNLSQPVHPKQAVMPAAAIDIPN